MFIRPPRSVCCVFFALVLILPLAGCGDPAADSADRMRALIRGVYAYHATHDDRWPDTLDAIAPHVDGDLGQLLANPVTGDDPGYEYVKPAGPVEVIDPSRTVILYQLRGGQRDLSLSVGYADTSVQAYRSNDPAP